LKRLLDLGAPEIIVNNEKRMLQEAVDALFDNGRRGRPVTGPGNRPLKSLSDMLKGKQGRFRQNLLGKRVDYSGRSVIVVGPTLKLHQCGLPKLMALELFKPFVMKRLDDLDLAPNIKSAKRMVERRRSEVWDVLEEIIKEHPVLLNRAPTLHRLGIQAFEPVLVDGKAIQIHPLVCAAFNADFDGDQMAVHLPLSAEAQAEARVLMLSANNILSPADGRPMTVPSQDMIIGGYYLTELRGEYDGQEEPVFRHFHEIERAVALGQLELHRPIIWRTDALALEDGGHQVTTAGRVLFNKALPEGFPYVNRTVKKSDMGDIVGELSDGWRTNEVAAALDRIKDLTYKYATKSGLTISIDDVRVPPDKAEILERYEGEAERVENQFRRGIITDGERRQKEVEIWTSATEEVRASLERELKATVFNPIDMMVGSGARGNMMQVRQIAAIRGLVANPRGDIIPRPIKSSYREGLAMLEYFISTPGARKGLVDTALRTADSGYLTRRLVDVAQELIINEESPFERSGPVLGLWLEDIGPDTADKRTYLETRLFSRCLAQDVELTDGVMEAGTLIGDEEMVILRDDPKVTRVQVLSPLTDNSEFGVSAKAYGSSLATRQMIEVGEAVGVIAAQSIGEPGTQLTMRTFHTGGVAGSDIAGGLPRVVELFEARTPKGKATLASRTGVVRIGDDDGRGREILVVGDDGEEETHTVSTIARLAVVDGQEVKAGDPLVDGPRDPKELLEIRGVRETQQYLVEEVQKVYREQGVSIHDKHIELIIRQMTRRVLVGEPGESVFLPGEQVDQRVYAEVNRSLVQEGQRPAEARPVIMGITKASLATDSWLSAASFQETTRVLTEAAIESRRDDLKGLKENIIIGKLIPAGTGQGQYRNIDTTAPDYEPMEFFTSDEDLDPAEWLATIGSEEGGDVVQLGDAG
jgi:DNA-directed RNA polymerase subunit beta'